ncbi:glycyl-tRNA synthetase [Cryphonectria parasitica EP155]|uniref:glycine--tRNA ligase n=1 Tax=Cryphonectria parasitica (strain ATCC 38755 / EP155) TaxID=660469 RepID=A0A9P5CUB9_CRYP1|nr:glycyl-tRNA synthetase [Cryphonectria parasitica EP155]KAF3770567.1 glycyl-tRNA synthetase [Cryphonectria parasitica EP155]
MATLTTRTGQTMDRQGMESMLRRRMFYTPAFEIYGGVAGLYDYGPPGCALQANLIETWRKHFVLEEDMLEVDCSVVTPHDVFKTSGHVDKFADWMCKDPKNGENLRADHLVEAVLEARLEGDKKARGEEVQDKEVDPKKKKKKVSAEVKKLDDALVKEYEEVLAQIDNYDGDALGGLIKKYDIRNPATGAEPSPPRPFNLMFQTTIGPSGKDHGYLRPETAQGQFLNFAKLLEFNMQNMPFASASIGKSYRNEISPRAGLLRVREFLMAEIEHFVDPEGGKKHPRFPEVENLELTLLDKHTQLSGQTTTRKITIGQAVKDKVVDNETLGYFMARIHLYLERVGADMSKVRFRQHMANEMAHYACDCWDAEMQTSYGWIECVGCADRSAYDLTVHQKKTGAPLIVRQVLTTPIVEQLWVVDIDRKKFGPHFKKDGKLVAEAIEALDEPQLAKFAKDLEDQGSFTIDVPGIAAGNATVGKDLVKIEYKSITKHSREYTPNVIEPSFGIGRILYSLIEHSFWTRGTEGGDEARGVLSFPPAMAPTKVLIVPLSKNEEFSPIARKMGHKLRQMGISSRVDDSGASIGKRYSRNDELGTAFGITIDFQTVKDGSVTLRERDSTRQVRADESRILEAVQSMVNGSKSWKDVEGELPKFETQELEIREA